MYLIRSYFKVSSKTTSLSLTLEFQVFSLNVST